MSDNKEHDIYAYKVVYLYTKENPILLYERSIYLFYEIYRSKIELIPTQRQIVFFPSC
jgi:hypothetical protein